MAKKKNQIFVLTGKWEDNSEWETVFANNVSDKGPYPEYKNNDYNSKR